MNKISAVYKITNEATGDFYIGSSKNVYRRWGEHKMPSTWNRHQKSKLYHDMQEYGLDKFKFEIIVSIIPECLRVVEQDCIDLMHPTYNQMNAKGLDVERYKETLKAYRKTEKRKAYEQSEKYKAIKKAYNQTEKHKAYNKAYLKEYNSQLCNYKDETLTLAALSARFSRAGIPHSVQEAKKYLIQEQ